MAAHYGKERSKYGTLTGSVITWPVEVLSPNDPNNPDAVAKLPAGYLRCDGRKYNANDYPDLAAICGTGEQAKFRKIDQNGDTIGTIGDDEFVVPDLGSKYPRPSPADSGVFNNILEETQNGTFIKRSGIGITATSNVGAIAEVTYTGNFIVPSQTIPLKGKPSWTWGNDKYTDIEAVDNAGIHPHMHFSTTTRVRIEPRSANTGGVISLPDISYDISGSDVTNTFNGTAIVGFGTGSGEVGGFSNPGVGSGYVAFGTSGTSPFSTLQNPRIWSVTVPFAQYTLISITSIMGNDNNGGERVNNPGEGVYITWPDGTTEPSPILPSRQESGLTTSSYDAQYQQWVPNTYPIPAQFLDGSYSTGDDFTVTFTQLVRSIGGGGADSTDPGTVGSGGEQTGAVWESNPNDPGYQPPPGPHPNGYDMSGIVLIGFSGGFIEDTSLTFDGNQQPGGRSYFQTASTIPIDDWLDATDGGQGPGSNQPACWAIASGGKAGTPNTSQNLILGTQYTAYYNFCDSGCSLANLRCYCLLGDQVSYDLSQDYFGFEGTEYANYFSLFTGGCQYSGSGATWNTSGNSPVTYQAGKQGVPYDWQGLPLSDVVPINSNITEQESYPQATNMFTEIEENEVDGDPTQHNHKIVVDRQDHSFKYVTDTFLLSPEALNTTVALTPSTVASIDAASAPFIILEYLIKT